MLEKFRKYIYPVLSKLDVGNNNELYLHLIMHVALIYTFLIHAVLFAIFAIAGVGNMMLLNAASLLVYTLLYLIFLRRKRYRESAIALCLEVTVYCFVSVYFIGLANYTVLYFLIILILQVIIPYDRAKFRMGMAVCFWLAANFLLLMGYYHPPMLAIGVLNVVLAVFNVNFTIVGVLSELLVGSMIRRIINRYNRIQMEELKEQAYIDPLTKLFNRRYADVVFHQIERDKENTYFVAFLDIDDFKVINDLYGHALGDSVLVNLAGTIKGLLRKTDFVFRWGGEEFLIILKNVDATNAVRVLENLRQAVEKETVSDANHTVHYTVSIGAVPLDTGDIAGSIEESDKRLYASKISGKNKVML